MDSCATECGQQIDTDSAQMEGEGNSVILEYVVGVSSNTAGEKFSGILRECTYLLSRWDLIHGRIQDLGKEVVRVYMCTGCAFTRVRGVFRPYRNPPPLKKVFFELPKRVGGSRPTKNPSRSP